MELAAPTPLRPLSPAALQTHACKTDGCAGEATSNRGPYAYLCTACRLRVKQERASAIARNAGKHESKVRALLPLAKNLDKALGKYAPVREELSAAMAAWAKAIEELAS